MTDKHSTSGPDGLISIRPEDLDDLLTRAAERGAERCSPQHPPVSREQAETYLREDLRTALAATLRFCPVLAAEPEGRLAAIVDFTFNLGAGRLQTSTLRRRINQRDWATAANELGRWVYGGGKVLPGLVARRAEEVSLLRGSLGEPDRK